MDVGIIPPGFGVGRSMLSKLLICQGVEGGLLDLCQLLQLASVCWVRERSVVVNDSTSDSKWLSMTAQALS